MAGIIGAEVEVEKFPNSWFRAEIVRQSSSGSTFSVHFPGMGASWDADEVPRGKIRWPGDHAAFTGESPAPPASLLRGSSGGSGGGTMAADTVVPSPSPPAPPSPHARDQQMQAQLLQHIADQEIYADQQQM